MNIYLRIATYFIIYSFLGWVVESTYKSVIEKKLINSGFLFGPFCPIYGFGAIIMYLFLDDVSNKPIITFCLGFVVLSVWEYVAGLFLEKVFNTKYWDYSNNKFNLQGRVCLLNSVFWGILGMVFIDVLNPIVTSLIEAISIDKLINFNIIAYIIVSIDVIVSVVNTFSITEKIKYVEELNKNIKDKIEEIKEKGIGNEISQSLQEALEDLKSKRDSIVQKSYNNILRIKKAFPTMKSDQISNFLKSREKKEDK